MITMPIVPTTSMNSQTITNKVTKVTHCSAVVILVHGRRNEEVSQIGMFGLRLPCVILNYFPLHHVHCFLPRRLHHPLCGPIFNKSWCSTRWWLRIAPASDERVKVAMCSNG